MKISKINIKLPFIAGNSTIAPKAYFGIFYTRKLANQILLIILVSLSACEDRYWPDLGDKYHDLLVVEGMITNEPGPYTIQLSMSTSVDHPVYQPLPGYEVIINDNSGNTEILIEVEPGIYKTAVDGIQGVPGRKYQITIQSPNGKIYQSDFEELKEPVEIDSVYVELEYRENAGFPFDIAGYQFLLNTEVAKDDSSYFLWKLERTFEYHADFRIYFWYDGELHIFPDTDSLQICWRTGMVYQIFTESTVGLSNPILTDFPLHYVSFDNREFSVRYSLLVEQFTISKNAQEYWKNVKEQNTSGGELYTKMPFQVRGNIKNINNPDEPVLGYFHAAGIDTKRVFIDRPGYQVEMYYPVCELKQSDFEEYGLMFRFKDPRDWPRYVTMNANFARAVPVQSCLDCRKNGGTIEKPEFWVDF
ncbi:MAG: DUF4249 domain-containing protein [Bacteroidales bacterium]|nr:DUF4249 domain-containing protein [Bacteroidales bacterium]